jgi:hypothetical protein
MKPTSKAVLAAATVMGVVAFGSAAQASDTLFQTFVGNYGVSTSGWGSASSSTGTISTESIAAGSTVTAAYLYTSTYSGQGPSDVQPPITPTGSLNGTSVNYNTALGLNSSACSSLQAWRADVTSIVQSEINGGPGGVYNFTVGEGITTGEGAQDGEALVVVYQNAAQATQTIAILNGAASSTGDMSTVNFGGPVNPSDAGFFAHMIIGDGFSCCGQESTITVNGQVMTNVAGNNDDSVDGTANGDLITVGHMAGPYTGGTPGSPQNNYSADHEAYDLAPFISNGDTSVTVNTINASRDDNIFLQVYDFSGEGSVTIPGVPEPATWAMFLLGFGAIGWTLRSRRSVAATA